MYSPNDKVKVRPVFLKNKDGNSAVIDGNFRGSIEKIKFCSWNCRALWHTDDLKRSAKIGVLLKLMKRFNIIMLQETHFSSDVMPAIRRRFPKWMIYESNHSQGQSKAGCAFFISPYILCNYESRYNNLIDGHLQEITIRKNNFGVQIINAYLDSHNDLTKISQLELIQNRIKSDVFCVMGGDWNFIETANCGKCLNNEGEMIEVGRIKHNVIEKMGEIKNLHGMREEHNKDFTFSHCNKRWVGKLDRFYSNLSDGERSMCSMVNNVLFEFQNSDISDHTPVEFSIYPDPSFGGGVKVTVTLNSDHGLVTLNGTNIMLTRPFIKNPHARTSMGGLD